MLMNVDTLLVAYGEQIGYDAGQSLTNQEMSIRFLNRAYRQLLQDAPFLFFEEEQVLELFPTYTPPASTDTVKFLQPFLLRRIATTTAVPLDSSLLGLYAIAMRTIRITGEYTSTETDFGSVSTTRYYDREHTIREAWIADGYLYMSLFEACQGLFTAIRNHEFNWQIYAKNYYMPQELVKFTSALVTTPNGPINVDFVTQGKAVDQYLRTPDINLADVGIPKLFRNGFYQLSAPTTAPQVASGADEDTWDGPEPEGTWEYCYTYFLGVRLSKGTTNRGSSLSSSDSPLLPFVESPPSPISTVIAPDSGMGIVVLFPNIEYLEGYSRPAAASEVDYGRSGFGVAVYRRRVVGANDEVTGLIPPDDKFHLLTISALTYDSATGRYYIVDTGAILAQRNIVLSSNTGYQMMGLYPPATTVQQLKIRGIYRPENLVDLSDAPRCLPEATDALIYKMSAYYYTRTKRPQDAAIATQMYEIELEKLRKKFSSYVPDSTVFRRRPAGVFNGGY